MFIFAALFVVCLLLTLAVSDAMERYGETRALRSCAQLVALGLLFNGTMVMVALGAAVINTLS